MRSNRLAARSFVPAPRRLGGLGALLVAAFGLACEPETAVPNSPIFPGPTDDTPPSPLPLPHACNVRVRELAVFQAVKIPLLVNGQPVALNAPLIEGRRALFRAYFDFDGTRVVGNSRARLRLESSTGVRKVDGQAYIGQPSSEERLESTVNFDVPAELMRGDLKVAIELELGDTCATGGRKSYPEGGLLALPLVDTGKLKITLVPVAYDTDGSGRLPDFSQQQLGTYYSVLLATYPVGSVEMTIREPVRTRIALNTGNGWGQFLDSMRAQKMEDGAGIDVHYYALVAPAASFNAYCNGQCIAGLSYLAEMPSVARQVGAGVGFTGAVAGETLVHELGHQHGRGHAPCMTRDGVDGRFPYPNGRLGVWGFDFRAGQLMNPTTRADMMSYCEPIWISDYTYSALADRRRAVNASGTARVIEAGSSLPRFRGFRSLLVGDTTAPIWGRPLPGDMRPDGKPETAEALDSAGKVVANVTVYRNSYGHGVGASFDVPTPENGWASLRIAGQPPLRFSDPVSVPKLDRMVAPNFPK